MLTLSGPSSRFCDGLSRRSFLRIGGLGMGGLTLSQLLRAEAASGMKSNHKAVIMVYLPGGPPHQDTFDLKMDAPAEIRGEFRPIPTTVPGFQVCEHLPLLAKQAHRYAVIRSISDAIDDHSDFMCQTGRRKASQPPGGWPTFGATVSRVMGPATDSVPAFVGLEPRMQHRPYNAATAGYAGVSHDAFRPAADAKSDMVLNGITTDRLADRRSLLTAFDRFRREADASGLMSGVDGFNQQAFGMLTSSRLLEALNVEKESAAVRERYGKGDPKVHGDAAPMLNEQFLVARRLVEAGARFVTVAYGFWDYHGNNFGNARNDLPLLDQALSALIADLHDRGLQNDVSVIAWGEFGRSPTINKDGGRDHWPRANCALLAGGGMKVGQVIGATDRLGGEPSERPVQFGEVFATLYQNLGIDVNKVTVPDLTGRPQFLVPDGCQPMRELVS
ncbi:MAG: DUF1501 domain-containing protein [Verrucomicrobiota bacterium]|jgi:hypothetical protein|nr:DUF1501 domain-containing protein [Verrucomicrobiota bacterium]